MQIFVEYKYISYSFGFHCNSQIWHKSSKRKICRVFLVKKCNPLHKFSFDINVTFFPGVQLIKRTETIAAERKGRIMSIQKYLWAYNRLCKDTTVTTQRVSINPLHPKISMHILHTVFYTFPQVLTRRFCRTIKSSCTCWSFPLFSWS